MASCKDCIHNHLCLSADDTEYIDFETLMYDCKKFINKADVVKVVRGEWLQTTEPLGWHDVDCVECSACHESWICDEDFDFECCKEFWKYCPHCGAVMVS